MSKKRKKPSRRRSQRRPKPPSRQAALILPKRVPQVDVVIPVYGRPDMLTACLAALEETAGSVPMTLTIVDDKGPDQEALEAIYKNELPTHAKVVRNAQNMGFPFSANVGAAQGNAPLIVFLSTDIEMREGCLQAMMAEMAEHPKTGVVGAKLVFPDVSDDPGKPVGKIQHAGLCVNIQGDVIHANIGWNPGHEKVCERRVLQAVTGGLLMTRREAWNKIHQYYKSVRDQTNGGFNLVYGKGTYEDVEYCIAVRGNNSYDVVYVPEAVAVHHVGASISLDDKGFALGRNAGVFKARCGHLLYWDNWRFC